MYLKTGAREQMALEYSFILEDIMHYSTYE